MSDDYVACQICGIMRKRLANHIKTVHHMTVNEYKEQFPKCRTISETEYLRCVRHNQSKSMREMISERNRTPEFIEKCKAGITEEVRQRHAEVMREVSKKCWSDEEYRRKTSERVRQDRIRESSNPVIKARRSEMFKKLWQDPDFVDKALKAPTTHPYGKASSYYSDKFNTEFLLSFSR